MNNNNRDGRTITGDAVGDDLDTRFYRNRSIYLSNKFKVYIWGSPVANALGIMKDELGSNYTNILENNAIYKTSINPYRNNGGSDFNRIYGSSSSSTAEDIHTALDISNVVSKITIPVMEVITDNSIYVSAYSDFKPPLPINMKTSGDISIQMYESQDLVVGTFVSKLLRQMYASSYKISPQSIAYSYAANPSLVYQGKNGRMPEDGSRHRWFGYYGINIAIYTMAQPKNTYEWVGKTVDSNNGVGAFFPRYIFHNCMLTKSALQTDYLSHNSNAPVEYIINVKSPDIFDVSEIVYTENDAVLSPSYNDQCNDTPDSKNEIDGMQITEIDPSTNIPSSTPAPAYKPNDILDYAGMSLLWHDRYSKVP